MSVMTPEFIAGYAPLPSDFDSMIQAPFAFLTSKVVFRAELSNALTWTNGSNVTVPYNVIDEDPFSGWSASSHTWTCPAGMSGTYALSVTLSCAASADLTTSLRAGVNLNGGAVRIVSAAQTSGTFASLASGTASMQLFGGQDQVSVYGLYTSSGNGSAVTTAGQRCTFEVNWISL